MPAQRLSCRAARPLVAIATAILLGLATTGCSYKLSGFGKDDGPEQTSAVTPIRARGTVAPPVPRMVSDQTHATAAASGR